MPFPAAITNPLPLASALIRCASVTPHDHGVMNVLLGVLDVLGFTVQRHTFGVVENLYARLGTQRPNLCFAGHLDVVPAGDEAQWSVPPFAGEVRDGKLWGRGAADMKGGVAAFIAAVARHLEAHGPPKGSLSLLITGDEEGPAIDGTRRLLVKIAEAGERIDHCVVGEPSGVNAVADALKVGRRGSLNAHIRVHGRQGHVAYPERAENPIPVLLDLLARLTSRTLDVGAPHFQPSNLVVTSFDVGNPAHNVIPAQAAARLNIRFNTNHTGETLERWIRSQMAAAGEFFDGRIEADIVCSGDAFLTPHGPFTALLSEAVAAVTGKTPVATTHGGTSDARFIKDYAPVAELGLCGQTIHKVDEHVSLEDLETLTAIYGRVIASYFVRDWL